MNYAAKCIFIGNILLTACCAFYLSWWIAAFKPVDPVKGIRSGWLLIPALIAGVAGAGFAVRGISQAETARALFTGRFIFIAAVTAYVVLLVGTLAFFKRPVTTELILIVAWTALMVSEVNALYGISVYSYRVTVAVIAGLIAVAFISVAAYAVYYKLDAAAGFADGMLPLILAAFCAAAIDVGLYVRS